MSKETIVGVVDAGGRGAALVDAYSKDPAVDRVLVFPGHDLMGINSDKPVDTFPGLTLKSRDEIAQISYERGVSLVDVAQDNAVEVGTVDALRALDVPVIGPTKAAGRIESDKVFARRFGERHGLAQPAYEAFTSVDDGLAWMAAQNEDTPWYVKAAGLAEGKGALPAKNRQEAMERIRQMNRFKDAGNSYTIEEWLMNDDGTPGEEFSAYAIGFGDTFKLIGVAQDNKRVFNNDEGPNTGGMGSVSPVGMMDEGLRADVMDIFGKTFTGLAEEGSPYSGVLYLGGMRVREGGKQVSKVIEFNARWGDPEAQVIVPGIKKDLYRIGLAVAHQDVSELQFTPDGKQRVAVTGASHGYPDDYSHIKGHEIHGLHGVQGKDHVTLYGAGVKVEQDRHFGDGRHYASGGRLFYVVGEGTDILEARERAYGAIAGVYVEGNEPGNGLHYRTDVGARDVRRLYTGK